ncbi:MAG TPA: metal-dependent transcriptional regulator [Firmicutes bacterium]|nr:metal-dependent transcriptional regulator [Bacillota bacterium]
MPHVLTGSSSMQDYLEAILDLAEKDGLVRVSDIASRLSISKPSVTQMIENLKKQELVKQEPYGPVELTGAGRELATKVRQRHRLLKKFLIDVLEVDPEIAERDACMIEHVISPQTMEKLVEFLAVFSTREGLINKD